MPRARLRIEMTDEEREQISETLGALRNFQTAINTAFNDFGLALAKQRGKRRASRRRTSR